jgi:hypothetical protein
MGRFERDSMFANLYGLTSPQADVMLRMRPSDVDRTGRYLQGIGLNPSEVNATAFADIAGAVAAPADRLGEYRQHLLDRTGNGALSDAEKSRLGGESGETLRRDIVQLLASHGMEQTEAQKNLDATTALTNALTQVGKGILPGINDLKLGLATVVAGAGSLTQAVSDLYEYLVHGDGGKSKGGAPRRHDAGRLIHCP